MRRLTCSLTLVAVFSTGIDVAAQSGTNIVRDVRATIAADDFAAGQALIDAYRSANGVTPEMMAALSWMARGTYAVGEYDLAAQYSVDTYELASPRCARAAWRTGTWKRRLAPPSKPTRWCGRPGAIDPRRSISSSGRSKRIVTPRSTSGLQKNVNLLSLAGQPAPALEAQEYLGQPSASLDDLKGNVVLLFFWAHWCPDCKAQGPAIESVLSKYRAQGLRVIAPTQRFGYIVSGQDAPPDQELAHIAQVLDESYAFLRDEGVPVGDATHKRYGVSTTPTLVLVDREGIVRLYRPGQLTEAELDAAVRELL